MATNQFFNSNFNSSNKDQSLLQSLTTETIQIYGVDCIYVPRELVNYDELFGDDQSSLFQDSFIIELYVKNVDSFGGDGKFLSKFGLEIRDEMTFSVSRPRFHEVVSSSRSDISKPREGDLIWVQSSIDRKSRAYEISYVSSEEFFYQLGNTYTWEIKTKVFELSGENFKTGIDHIDSIEDAKIKTTFELSSGSGSFNKGEIITFINFPDSKATVFDHSFNNLVVSDLVGEVPTNGLVIGDSASYTIIKTIGIDNEDNQNLSSNNEYTKQKVIDFVDFTEINPFSE
jgi:hypothetical protein